LSAQVLEPGFFQPFKTKTALCLRSSLFFDCLTFEDGTDMLFRNVGNLLQVKAA